LPDNSIIQAEPASRVGLIQAMKSISQAVLAVLTASALVLGCSSPPTRRADGSDKAAGRYAAVNGLNIYYEIHGAGGTPLVLLHGGGSTIEISFAAVLPSLAKTRQVVAFEQQGHGHTADIADRPFTFEQSADDAVALLQYLKIEKADFFGYSNGGSIAMQIAIRHPQRVRKLVVESAMYKRDGMVPGFWESMQRAKLENMPAELQQAYQRPRIRSNCKASMTSP
jgi:pimeloyl-ACP methyl ester carboxylesterase